MDYKRNQIPSQLGVPYDLLEASDPEPALIKLVLRHRHKSRYQFVRRYRGRPRSNICVPAGGHYTVQKRDTFGQQLSQLGRRVTPYELIKYNYNIDPGQPDPSHWLQGSSWPLQH